MKKLSQEIETYKEMLNNLSEVTDEKLKEKGIISMKMINEVFTKNPIPPRVLIKKSDGTEYKIDGYKEITDHLKQLLVPMNNEPKEKLEIKQKVEKCVSCGKDTSYTTDTHIDYRMYYIEGAGQLCEECYNEIYK